MRVVKTLRYGSNEIPVCVPDDGEAGKFILVSKSLMEAEKNNTATFGEFKDYLKEMENLERSEVKIFADSYLEKIINLNKSRLELIRNTSELELGATWEYIEEAFAGYDLDNAVRSHIAVVRKGSSKMLNVYLTPNVKDVELLQDAYKAITHNIEKIDWYSGKQSFLAVQNVVDYIFDQHKLTAKRSRINNSKSENNKNKSDALALVAEAVSQRATDIHIHYYESEMGLIEFRIDTLLGKYESMGGDKIMAICRSIFNLFGKNVTGVGFAEGSPQETDAVIDLEVNGEIRDITLRWQSLPTASGFKVVLRVLDNNPERILKLTYEQMGYEDQHQAMLQQVIQNKKGFILTTGTTGSGKSTTNLKIISSMIEEHPSWAFNTVEDPIEYRIPGVSQHPVKLDYIEDKAKNMNEGDRKKLAFEKLLTSLMRFDPDVIGVGEIRDETTSELVRDFVNTGHKILATLHADNALYTYDRLEQIGMDRDTSCRPGFFAIIIYQLLMPRTCSNCGTSFDNANVDTHLKNNLTKIYHGKTDSIIFHNPKGCSQCNYTGVHGMTVCAEMLIPDEAISELIRDKRYVEAKKYWLTQMPPVKPDAEYHGHTIEDHMLWKVKKGLISPLLTSSHFPSFSVLARKQHPFLDPNYAPPHLELVSREVSA